MWPSPLRVLVRCFSGASLEAVVWRSLLFSSVSCNFVVIHAGVNDASHGRDSFASDFASSCDFARLTLASRFAASRIVISLLCLTSDLAVNARIAVANRQLRDMAFAAGFGLISNDNLRISDLTDVVHLNAAGTARLYNNILSYLRADAT